jgi:hypothetical protein
MARAYLRVLTARWPISIGSALCVCAVLAVSGCASRRFDALVQSWRGHSMEELFRTWGSPNYLYADGKGGHVAVYVPTPSTGIRKPDVDELMRTAKSRVYEPGMKNSWPIYRIFFADPGGRIVVSEWRGQWECCSS